MFIRYLIKRYGIDLQSYCIIEAKSYNTPEDIKTKKYKSSFVNELQEIKIELIKKYIKTELCFYDSHHDPKIKENIRQGNYLVNNNDIFKILLEKSEDFDEYKKFLLEQEKSRNDDLNLELLINEVYDVLKEFALFALVLPNNQNIKIVKFHKDMFLILDLPNSCFIKVNGTVIKKSPIKKDRPLYETVQTFLNSEYLGQKIVCVI